MEFLIVSIAFLILLLIVVWRPFFKQNKQVYIDNSQLRHDTNVGLYREHKKEIEKDYSDGGIDEENYQYLIAELDNTLLQDIDADKNSGQLKPNDSKAYSTLWPVGLSIFIIVFSVALYNQQGSYKLLTEMPEGHGQQAMSQDEMRIGREDEAKAHIKKLQAVIESNKDDTEAWYNLGQTYVALGAFDAAVLAFKQVIRVEGEHADLLGAIAQAIYYKNGQKIDPQVQLYIDKALALDVNDPSTNILLGMQNFIAADYTQAITHWQRVIDNNKQGVNIDALKEAVAEAKIRLGMPAPLAAKPSTAAPSTEAATSGPQLKVSVSLGADITQQMAAGEERVVFIYAVPTNGQRMPLAAIKLKTSDLPKVVVLNNSQAMSPANNLGSVDNVHVYAVASKNGGVGIKAGDFKAEALNIDVNQTETIELIVNSLVK